MTNWIKKIKECFSKKETQFTNNQSLTDEIEGDAHPIPSELVDRIDIITTDKEGRTELTIISAGYLDDSDYTAQRIIDKINTYLCFINDDEFLAEFGKPSVERTTIRLNCNRKPDPSVFTLIESLQEQVNQWNSSLIIDTK